MRVPVRYRVDAYHRPSGTWHCYRTPVGVPTVIRAVSVKAALRKALRVATAMPCYADRVNHPDWEVEAEAHVFDGR